MKKTLLALTLAALTSGAATTVLAADPKAPAQDIEISGNFGLFSDYRFRGVSQTDKDPALQGGFDLNHKSGLYIGTWGSNVDDWASTSGSGMEIDLYGGFTTEIGGLGLDVGMLRYMYPSNTANQNTTEWYVGASYSFLSYKFSKSTTKLFGVGAKGSTYHALGAEFPMNDQLSLYAHYGRTDSKSVAKFSDYKIGVSYALPGDYSVALDYIGTSGMSTSEGTGYLGTGSKKLYDSTAVISLSKSF